MNCLIPPLQAATRSSTTLRLFLQTRRNNSEAEYFKNLVALRPDGLAIAEIAEIVQWIESNNLQDTKFSYPHVNVFGTGGDGTINVSSIASIIASHLIPIVKVGTSAVTSRFGSSDFFAMLHREREDSQSSSSIDPRLQLGPQSDFLPLASLGFAYNPALRAARKRLHQQGIPDIYKIVFPFSDYTKPLIQINGASRRLYFDILVRLCERFKRSACVLYSEHQVDELAPGTNELFISSPTYSYHETCVLPRCSEEAFSSVLMENSSARQSIDLLTELIAKKANPLLKAIIAANAALYVTCHDICSDTTLPFPDTFDTNLIRITNSL